MTTRLIAKLGLELFCPPRSDNMN